MNHNVKYKILCAGLLAATIISGCGHLPQQTKDEENSALKPVAVTSQVRHDTDDPAIWVNPKDPSKSLIIGTDKDADGGLYVFDLAGRELTDKTVHGLKRPNNVDIAYGLMLGGKPTDIAVVTERMESRIRVYRLPDMQPVDGGGIAVFTGETGEEYTLPMGIALYKRPRLTGSVDSSAVVNSQIYAIVSRKNGPKEGYLWQYLLQDDGHGQVEGMLVRKFGRFSGKKEIESIAVDQQLGFVYYSDERAGIRQYYADPEKGNEQLSIFGVGEFKGDSEGISIYPTGDSTGFILVSNQQDNSFNVYPREGTGGRLTSHQLIGRIPFSTLESDGSDVVNVNLSPRYPKGIFVAMSNGRVFQYYDWRQIEARLK